MLNCLPPHLWFEYQSPIWRFSLEDVRSDFERNSKKVHPAIFPRVLARRIIETFSHRGETVVDVFSGVGTALVAASELGRSAIGFELNPHYVALARRRLAYIRDLQGSRIKVGDGEKLIRRSAVRSVQLKADARFLTDHIPQNSIDLVLTSPPYWDLLKQRPSSRNKSRGKYLKKNYSKDSRDLSNQPTLKCFLSEMSGIFSQIHQVLKPGKRFVLITGDYRRQGQYIPLHAIYIKTLADIGLELNNIMLWDRCREYDVGLYSYPHRFIAVNGMIEYVMEFVKD
ncbi:MAG: site-specific DNA-methyltransferase [Thermoplasmata archaeon]|nr:MAG: site-specific DNA-methyltransferase [Thermoplasmata archaeon]